jgi:hypothetical protein
MRWIHSDPASMARFAMKLFLDVEWADTLASELVSVALVSSDGQHVFYAERDPLPADPSPWVKTVVYPLLERGSTAMNDAALTRRLREFLAMIPYPWICYDTGYDRSLCQFVIDGMDEVDPDGPTVDVRWQRLDGTASACERWWKDHPEHQSHRHHARFDAAALRGAYFSRWGDGSP